MENKVVKLGFVAPEGNPPLTTEQSELIKESIRKTIIISNNGPHAHFQGIKWLDYWLMIQCANHNAAEWIRLHFKSIKMSCDFDIKLVEEDHFPPTRKMRINIDSFQHLTNESILHLIKAQNNLCTEKWNFGNRQKIYSNSFDDYYLSALVDEKSFETLKARNLEVILEFSSTKMEYLGSQI